MNDLPDPKCADCKAFYKEARDIQGNVTGLCRLRPELGDVPSSMTYCYLFRIKDARRGIVRDVEATRPAAKQRSRRTVNEKTSAVREIATLNDPITGDTTGEINMDRDGLKQVLRELLEEETLYGYPEIGARWEGGTMLLKPADPELQPKEIPLEGLFHKIVMIRDRLRVLEAKLNSSDKLSEQEKIELQGYISKCYGTLTTFNVLFKSKADYFSSK